MEINISKKEIFQEVEKRTSMEGFAVPENYDVVLANDSRGVLLDSFWLDGCNEVIQLMKRYISNDTVEHSFTQYDKNEVLSINAVMPARYSELMNGNISTDAKMIVACKILIGWLRINMPSSVPKYESELGIYLEDIKSKINFRTSPDNVVTSAKSDSESIDNEGSDLISAKSDIVKICNCDYGLDYPKEDNVELIQKYKSCF